MPSSQTRQVHQRTVLFMKELAQLVFIGRSSLGQGTRVFGRGVTARASVVQSAQAWTKGPWLVGPELGVLLLPRLGKFSCLEGPPIIQTACFQQLEGRRVRMCGMCSRSLKVVFCLTRPLNVVCLNRKAIKSSVCWPAVVTLKPT